jgi:H-type lectin domain
MQAGQPEDISQVLANFQAIESAIATLDESNLDPTADVTFATLGLKAPAHTTPGLLLDDNGSAGGRIQFGSGGVAPDVSLYRSGATSLRTDAGFYAAENMYVGSNLYLGYGTASDTWLYRRAGNTIGTVGSFAAVGARGGWGFLAYVDSDAQPTAYLRNDGYLYFGPGGSTALDTSLYRSGAGELRTDGQLDVGKPLWLTGADATNARIWFGSQLDTSLYRMQTSTIRTNSQMVIDTSLYVDWSNAGNRLNFGSAGDTSIHRTGAGSLTIEGTLTAYYTEFIHGWGIAVKTDGSLGIRFGAALDTNLYRTGYSALRTDGSFHVAGNLTVGGTYPGGGGGSIVKAGKLPSAAYGQGDIDVAVTFPSAFAAVPVVVTNAHYSDGIDQHPAISAPFSITTTGFTFRFRQADSQPRSMTGYWMAT